MILRKIPFVNKKYYSPGGLPVVAAEGGQRICWKIQNGGAEWLFMLELEWSSASAERVFSLLKNAFSKQQMAALEETVETSVMLCYNDNKRT